MWPFGDVMFVSGDRNKDGSGGETEEEVQGFVFSQLKWALLQSVVLPQICCVDCFITSCTFHFDLFYFLLLCTILYFVYWERLTLLLLLHPFNGLFSRTTWVSQYQKSKTSLDLNEARDDGVSGCSGIGWTICKQSAPCFRQITMPTPHHSIFTDCMLFLMPNPQCQSTDGSWWRISVSTELWVQCWIWWILLTAENCILIYSQTWQSFVNISLTAQQTWHPSESGSCKVHTCDIRRWSQLLLFITDEKEAMPLCWGIS